MTHPPQALDRALDPFTVEACAKVCDDPAQHWSGDMLIAGQLCAERIRALSPVPAPLWTRRAPTVPGVYWARIEDEREPWVEVLVYEDGAIRDEGGYIVSSYPIEVEWWPVPIAPPVTAESEVTP